MKQIKIKYTFLLICILTGMIFLNPNLIQKVQAATDKTLSQIRLITEVFMLIKNNYVEPVKNQDLVYGAAKGMVRTLDPFSQFLDPDDYKEIQIQTEGSFGGLGIRISMRDDWLTVVTPLLGTPAYKMGILPEDRIIKIEGETTKGITIDGAVKKLRGKPGTKVTITIEREEEEAPIDFTITREEIKIESISYKKLEEDDIGYIRIREFTAKTNIDIDNALLNLEKRKIKGLILDLRNNPGGLLTSAVDVCKKFIGDEKLIVYTQGRDKAQRIEYKAGKRAEHEYLPLVVIVNKGSASGSEIVAGAVKDWKRGVIVGTQTFGKGSVQTVIKLTSDESGLRLTTAKYYTPKGICIHEVGITPDVIIPIPKDILSKIMLQEQEVYIPKKTKKGKKTKAQRPKTEEKGKEKEKEKIEDPQLKQALALLKARILFLEAEKTFEKKKMQNKNK